MNILNAIQGQSIIDKDFTNIKSLKFERNDFTNEGIGSR